MKTFNGGELISLSKAIRMQSLLGKPLSLGSGITLVQSASGTTADGSAGLTVNFGVPVTLGNSVICLNSREYGNMADPTLVDGSSGNLNTVVDTSDDPRSTAFKAYIGTGGETGVYGSGQAVRFNQIIAEFSGLLDASAENTATNSHISHVDSPTTLAIGTITPTSPNNLLIASWAFSGNLTVLTPPSGWTLLETRIGSGTYQYVYYKIQDTATPDNPTIVIDGNTNITGVAAAFGGA